MCTVRKHKGNYGVNTFIVRVNNANGGVNRHISGVNDAACGVNLRCTFETYSA